MGFAAYYAARLIFSRHFVEKMVVHVAHEQIIAVFAYSNNPPFFDEGSDQAKLICTQQGNKTTSKA